MHKTYVNQKLIKNKNKNKSKDLCEPVLYVFDLYFVTLNLTCVCRVTAMRRSAAATRECARFCGDILPRWQMRNVIQN